MALLKKQQHTDQEESRFPLGRAARLMTLSALAVVLLLSATRSEVLAAVRGLRRGPA